MDLKSCSSNNPSEGATTLNKPEESGTSIQLDNDGAVASPDMSMHNQHLVCPMCSKSFAWKRSLDKHLKIHSAEKSFLCEICGRPFARKDDLKRHLGIHSREKYFRCKTCDRLVQKKYYDKHMLKHQEKKFNCEICSKTFLRNTYLKRHLKIHSQENYFKCEICGRSFQRKYYDNHMQKHQEKKYNCEICEKTFFQKDAFKRHKVTHSREKYFKCKICSRSFQRQCYYNIHTLKHQKKIFNCEVCEKTFIRKDALKRHKVTHSRKKYFCEICNRFFDRQFYYNKHLSKHNSGELNYELCDRVFTSVKTKKQHVRESHSASVLTSARRGVLPTAVESLKRAKREERALNTHTNVYFEPLEEMKGDFILFFEEVASHLQSKLNEELYIMQAIKWYGGVKASLVRFRENGEEDHATPYFRSDARLEFVSDFIEGHIQEAFSKIGLAFDEFVQSGSGWTLEKIEHFELCIAKFDPLRAIK